MSLQFLRAVGAELLQGDCAPKSLTAPGKSQSTLDKNLIARPRFYVPAENEDQLLHNHCSKKLIEFKESQLGRGLGVISGNTLVANTKRPMHPPYARAVRPC